MKRAELRGVTSPARASSLRWKDNVAGLTASRSAIAPAARPSGQAEDREPGFLGEGGEGGDGFF